MSASAADRAQRVERAGDEMLAVHLAVEEGVEQRPGPLRRHRRAVSSRQRAGEARRVERKL